MTKLQQLQAEVAATQGYANRIASELITLRATAAAWPADHQALIDHTEAAQRAFAPIAKALQPGGFGGGPGVPSLAQRINNAAGAERNSLSAPTTTSQDDTLWASSALAALLPRLRRFGATTLPQLEQAFTAAGAPLPAALPGSH
jgi:hypothetical protein